MLAFIFRKTELFSYCQNGIIVSGMGVGNVGYAIADGEEAKWVHVEFRGIVFGSSADRQYFRTKQFYRFERSSIAGQ